MVRAMMVCEALKGSSLKAPSVETVGKFLSGRVDAIESDQADRSTIHGHAWLHLLLFGASKPNRVSHQ
jgi:hypothetical protein